MVGFHAFQELRVNQVDLIDKMSGMAATRSHSCTSAGRDWVTFAHGERKLFIHVGVRTPSSSTSAMEVIHTDTKPCVLSNVASGTDNCTETLVEQPIDKCRSAEAGTPVCWQHDATSHPLRGRASVYLLLNQASHLTSFPEKSKFLCFSMLAHTGHDKAYPLSDQVDTPNTAGYKGYKVDSKKSKNARISQATQAPNRKLPDTAVHVSAVEPSIPTEWRKSMR